MSNPDLNFVLWILRGASTLELTKTLRSVTASLFLLAAIFGGSGSAQEALLGHSTLDLVDSSFNAQISTASYNTKAVKVIVPTSDGKILIAGKFNSYNGTATGALVRLNSDGSLDRTFNNNAVTPEPTTVTGVTAIAQLSDGKILVGGNFTLNGETTRRTLVRLNNDGSLDGSFAYHQPPSAGVRHIAVRANGKILLGGNIWSIGGVNKAIVQLNPDGTFDNTFDFTSGNATLGFALQADKLLVVHPPVGSTPDIYRLNADGSIDASFAPRRFETKRIFVQPSGKIIVYQSTQLLRLNADGSNDSTFPTINALALQIAMQPDGSMIVANGGDAVQANQIYRLSPNGARDASFAVYSQRGVVSALAVQADGKALIGDEILGAVSTPVNNFVRLNADGSPDAAFNAATGTGFQFLAPGKVRAIAVQPDNKILIGGKFDLVGNLSRSRMARLNADGTPDASFQIGVGSSATDEVYNIALQTDGKIIVSGIFTYFVGGVRKQDVARLNPDGSLDATFNLSALIVNYASVNNSGTNRIKIQPDGKVLIGTQRTVQGTPVPLRLFADGSSDGSFSSNYLNNMSPMYTYDIALQPDGKILIGGLYRDGLTSVYKSFLARLNSDGSLDATFQTSEESGKIVKSLALLPNGKILVAKAASSSEIKSEIVRLNSNGTLDSTFSAEAVVDGKINSLLTFADGSILVGGSFTKFGSQPRQNLALLSADGTLDDTLVNVNQEVLCLTADNQGRILVGGAFTTISGGGNAPAARTYIARLSAAQISSRTRFDFDGDRRADLAVFDQTNGEWSIRLSGTNQNYTERFGKSGDITVPADFDNDGKTDIAVYRPSEGIWYLLQSTAGFKAVRWGAAEDKPVAADYDGDGRADIAVWRPSNRVWYILQSSDNGLRAVYFGLSTDVPLREVDFDADGKADIAVYRPSDGGWYWLASGSNNEFKAAKWGTSGDVPVPADYNGDGKTDIAVYRPSEGVWYQQLSAPSGNYAFAAAQFGLSGDVPVVADYNGDGKADISIRRGEIWALLLSGQGFTGLSFGKATDQAVAASQP